MAYDAADGTTLMVMMITMAIDVVWAKSDRPRHVYSREVGHAAEALTFVHGDGLPCARRTRLHRSGRRIGATCPNASHRARRFKDWRTWTS